MRTGNLDDVEKQAADFIRYRREQAPQPEPPVQREHVERVPSKRTQSDKQD